MSVEQQYLVSYGHGGFLGRFRSDRSHSRDERVVVRSARGVELGTVLGEGGLSAKGPPLEGDVLRLAGETEENIHRDLRCRSEMLVSEAQNRCESTGLPMLFVDGEILLDGTAILQTIHWDECDATELLQALSRDFELHVQLADLTAKPKTGCSTCGAEKSGCDSCGTGGGCSTGSCSKGSVKSADELTSYFAGLRKQMEARIPLG